MTLNTNAIQSLHKDKVKLARYQLQGQSQSVDPVEVPGLVLVERQLQDWLLRIQAETQLSYLQLFHVMTTTVGAAIGNIPAPANDKSHNAQTLQMVFIESLLWGLEVARHMHEGTVSLLNATPEGRG